MRYAVLLIALFAVIFSMQCGSGGGNRDGGPVFSDAAEGDTAVIVFREYEHNFGKVAEGEKVGCGFIFENKGNANLAILSVSTSCGCTVPKYDKKPVPPGSHGTLEVVFDTSGRTGMQSKTISVRSNATIPVVMLKITAEVAKSGQRR